MWKLTKNGHEPTSPLWCPICKMRGHDKEMVLRWSKIQPHEDIAMELFFRRPDNERSKYLLSIFDEVEMPSWVNDMAWKCPTCDYWCVFGVPMKKEDAERIRKEERNGCTTFVPIEEWWQDAIIKDRLRNLGYW